MGATLAVVALSGTSSAEAGSTDAPAGPSAAEIAMSAAATECAAAETEGLAAVDDGRTITFDNRGGEDVFGADYASIRCVLDALDIPASIDTHIGQTTSLDGRQTAEWNGLQIQWSYHPDRGLDGLVTIVDG
ncbi:hypothetical protein ACPYO6_14475 [Georgenia sp. Z1344]|uniref:hypothetical protein n=1 Tax=Georgenia sp. Z1344 TaxID=3416706 RepID=UPI003CF7F84A